MEYLEEKEQNDASHLEDENTLDDENGDEPEKFEKQRYNEIISGKQKQIEHTREIAIESAVKLAKVDADSLVELHSKDPKLAEEVAKRFGYDSYSEAESVIKGKFTSKKKDDDEEDFDTKYAKKRAEEEHTKALSKAEKAIGKLDDDEQEKAQKYFEKITKGHQLDPESVQEFIDMVTLFVRKDKNNDKKLDKAQEDFHNSSVSKSKKTGDNGDDTYIMNGKLYTSNK